MQYEKKKCNFHGGDHRRHANDDPSGGDEWSSKHTGAFRAHGDYGWWPRGILLVPVGKVVPGMTRANERQNKQEARQNSKEKAD